METMPAVLIRRVLSPLRKTRFRKVLLREAVYSLHREHAWVLEQWFEARGDETLRIHFDLNPESTVFDLGGYTGLWAHRINEAFHPKIHIFEPNPQLLTGLRARFRESANVLVHPFAVSDRDSEAALGLDGMATSLYIDGQERVSVPVRDIQTVMEELCPGELDLMKINIEGAEFPLLRKLVETGAIRRIRNLIVQFHAFYPDARRLRADLRKALAKTHRCTWNYPFVWEGWKRIADAG